MVYFNKKNKYIKNKAICSIMDISFNDNTSIYVFEGSLSPNDILIKYSQGKSRIRTPKHIHWVVDLLIKREHNKQLVEEFLKFVSVRWMEITPLNDRKYETIFDSLVISKDKSTIKRFHNLDQYGYYNVDFLLTLMELLMLQEKTNRSDAYMFIKVVDALKNSNDLFSIISTATHR